MPLPGILGGFSFTLQITKKKKLEKNKNKKKIHKIFLYYFKHIIYIINFIFLLTFHDKTKIKKKKKNHRMQVKG